MTFLKEAFQGVALELSNARLSVSVLLLPADPDVEPLATSPALCLPPWHHASRRPMMTTD